MVVNIDNTRVDESFNDIYVDGTLSASGNIKGDFINISGTGTVKMGAATLSGAISGGTVGTAGGWHSDATCAGVAGTTQLTNTTVATAGAATTLPVLPATGAAGSFNTDATGDLWLIFTVGTLKYCVPAWCASG